MMTLRVQEGGYGESPFSDIPGNRHQSDNTGVDSEKNTVGMEPEFTVIRTLTTPIHRDVV